jgi:hypothetical protein
MSQESISKLDDKTKVILSRLPSHVNRKEIDTATYSKQRKDGKHCRPAFGIILFSILLHSC